NNPHIQPFPTRRSSDLALDDFERTMKNLDQAQDYLKPRGSKNPSLMQSSDHQMMPPEGNPDGGFGPGNPPQGGVPPISPEDAARDRKSTRLNSSHQIIS